jgi:hypothetical protein
MACWFGTQPCANSTSVSKSYSAVSHACMSITDTCLDEYIHSVLVDLLDHHVQQLDAQRHKIDGLDVVGLGSQVVLQISIVPFAEQAHEIQQSLENHHVMQKLALDR